MLNNLIEIHFPLFSHLFLYFYVSVYSQLFLDFLGQETSDKFKKFLTHHRTVVDVQHLLFLHFSLLYCL